VALGDSFTEGLGDPRPDGSGLAGWAGRFAERLAGVSPGLQYANLAVRGNGLPPKRPELLPLSNLGATPR
jgi:lysophospholipase L1-like esterase